MTLHFNKACKVFNLWWVFRIISHGWALENFGMALEIFGMALEIS